MKTILVDAVNTAILKNDSEKYIQFKELFDLLDTYQNSKLIVTNANDEQLIQFGLDSVPYPVFTMKHNPDKPNPIYFKTLLQQHNWKSEDVIYFEHNPDAVESAKSVGIISYNYNKDEKNLVALKKFIDENL